MSYPYYPPRAQLEGDDKHVNMMEKEWGMVHCNPVATPYVKPTACTPAAPGESEAKEMCPADANLHRRAAARIHCVALGPPDLSFASRVASSGMSNPKEGDYQIIKRIIRCMRGKPRVAIRYQFQEESEGLLISADSDWAGDTVTRKSTSRWGGLPRQPHHHLAV